MLGLAYLNKGAFNEAVGMFNNYVKFAPLSADAYLLRGMAYYTAKQFGNAKTDFEKVLQIDSSNEDATKYLDLIKENGF